MSSTLGEKLRQAREERGISINEVAEQTRISPHYLDLIEQDDYRTLPGGIFNKGFIKSFAKYVGVDEGEALQDYARLITIQTGEDSDEPKTYKPEVLTDDRSGSSMIPTVIFAVIILGLMTAGILALVNYIQSNPSVLTTSNTNANSANTNSANTNSNSVNANVAAPLPAMNEIKVEFKPAAEKINVTSTVDGKTVSEDITVAAPKTYTGQQSVRLKYYRGFADKVQISLNGKQLTPPPAPLKGNIIDFEVNKENIAQVLQSGQAAAPTTAVNANANTAPPR
jgi:cytoskeleton protein RodZ